MKDILMSATRLAEQIVNSDEYKNMRLLERDMANDERAQAAQLRYRMAQQEAIEAMNDVDHPERLKDATLELDAAEKAMQDDPLIAQTEEARRQFNQLMNNVNGILKLFITGDSDGAGCTGSCEGCSGCD